MYDVSTACYRLLVFRYIFVIAIGVFFALYRKPIRWYVLLLSGAIGGIYLYLSQYQGLLPDFLQMWSSTNLLACLWIAPLIYVCITRLSRVQCVALKPLALLGKASFNIFLMQMIYYFIFSGMVAKLVPALLPQYILHVVISVVAGLLFYLLETPITKSCFALIQKMK